MLILVWLIIYHKTVFLPASREDEPTAEKDRTEGGCGSACADAEHSQIAGVAEKPCNGHSQKNGTGYAVDKRERGVTRGND